MSKIKNEKGEVTTGNAETQRLRRDSYEQLYAKYGQPGGNGYIL